MVSKKTPKKEMIMKEAEKIFAEKGFHGTTIRDISKACQSNVALIYYYFNDKKDLYEHILDHTFQCLYEIVSESLKAGESEEEKVSHFIAAYIRFMGSRKFFARIMAREMAEGGRHIEQFVEKYLARSFGNLKKCITGGCDRSVFRNLDRDLTPLSLMGMMGFFFFASPMVKKVLALQDYDREFLDRLTAHTSELIFHGLKCMPFADRTTLEGSTKLGEETRPQKEVH
jgi:AcrR family transcriptional regulator